MEAEAFDTLVAQNKVLAQQINLLNSKLGNMQLAAMNTQIGSCDLCGNQGNPTSTPIPKLTILAGDIIQNFGWGGQGNEGQRNHSYNNPPYSQPYQNTFQPNHTYQPPPSPTHTQNSQKSTQPSSIESALEKLSLFTNTFVQQTQTFMQETRANFKDQEASIRNLEVQVGQIAKQLSKKPTNTLPSNTIPNPREECNAISLRSGKVVGEETTQSDEEASDEDKKQKEVPTPSLPTPTVKASRTEQGKTMFQIFGDVFQS
ncbi:hypothetical protein PIB30_064797 [Stylosanthes scabra]|uniref:Uncharacterized protein n=1 Tax=Stylosanthes scabra TaxID=79078 RepID=A0ABU6YMD1_9FABA|nr:hypothetical protein [Stylosanthes scabra]